MKQVASKKKKNEWQIIIEFVYLGMKGLLQWKYFGNEEAEQWILFFF
jgi:hypothetical protein